MSSKRVAPLESERGSYSEATFTPLVHAGYSASGKPPSMQANTVKTEALGGGIVTISKHLKHWKDFPASASSAHKDNRVLQKNLTRDCTTNLALSGEWKSDPRTPLVFSEHPAFEIVFHDSASRFDCNLSRGNRSGRRPSTRSGSRAAVGPPPATWNRATCC
jgi:hypothetical protein